MQIHHTSFSRLSIIAVALFLMPLLSIKTNTYAQINPTLTDELGDPINPGITNTYYLEIDNSETFELTDVNFILILEQLTDVPGTIKTTPLAIDDDYDATGNTTISVASPGLLTNDYDDGAVASLTLSVKNPGTIATTSGGSATLNADGSFTYTPPPGFEGVDSFEYELDDGDPSNPEGAALANSDKAVVTIQVSDMIWFIDNSAVAAGNGTLAQPFNTLAAFEAINGAGGATDPEAGDAIFIFTGSSSYIGGLTLENNQIVVGQGSSSSLETLAGITLAPNSTASLPATGGTPPDINDGIVVAQNNGLYGFDLGAATGFTVADNGGTVGALEMTDVEINNTTGGGIGLLNGGTLSGAMVNLSTAGGSHGIQLANVSGSLSVTATASFNEASIAGIHLQNCASFNLTINALNIINTLGGSGIDVTGGGTLSIAGGSIQTANGVALNISGTSSSQVTLTTINASLTVSSGSLVMLNNNTSGVFNLSGLDLVIANGTGFIANNSGTINITGAGNSITTANNTAFQMENTDIGTSGITLESINVTSSGAPAIILNGTGSSTAGFTVSGTGTVDGSGGTVSNISGNAILLTATENVNLSNMILGDGSAVAGQPLNLTKQIAGDAIVITNTVSTTLTNVKVTSTGGAAVNGSGGGNQNITLTDCEIFNIGDNGDGIPGGDEAALDFTGSSLSDRLTGILAVSNTVFDGMANNGIFIQNGGSGTLTMNVSSSTISNNHWTGAQHNGSADPTEGSGIKFEALSGGNSSFNLTVNGSDFTGIAQDGIDITLQQGNFTLDLDNTNFTSNPNGDNAVRIVDDGNTGLVDISLDNVQVTDIAGTPIFMKPTSGIWNIEILNSTINPSNGILNGRGIEIQVDGSLDAYDPAVNLNIENNTISNTGSSGIFAEIDDVLSGAAILNATITNNLVAAPLNALRDGMRIRARDNGNICLNITGNTSSGNGAGNVGIFVDNDATEPGGAFNLVNFVGDGADAVVIASFISTNNNSSSADADASPPFTDTVTSCPLP